MRDAKANIQNVESKVEFKVARAGKPPRRSAGHASTDFQTVKYAVCDRGSGAGGFRSVNKGIDHGIDRQQWAQESCGGQ